MINVTTDKCYENREWQRGYLEDDVLGGSDPYSNSKACAELVTSAYRRSFFERQGPAVATARAGNVLGGGDWARDRLVPDMTRLARDTGFKPVVPLDAALQKTIEWHRLTGGWQSTSPFNHAAQSQ